MTASRDNAGDEPRSALGRWARRKAEVAREDGTGQTADTAQREHEPSSADSDATDAVTFAEADDAAGSLPTTVDETPLLSDADMPDVDTLAEGSNFSQFMNPGVSDALRKRALSRLFRLPVFGIRDGLDDYDDDFRSFIPLGDTITADMRFEQQRLKERAQELLEKQEKEELAAAENREVDSTRKQVTGDDAGPALDEDADSTPREAIADSDEHADEDDDVGEAEDELV